MNKKGLGVAVALLTLAMLATPVLAIGPENAIGKNPNLESSPVSYDLIIEIRGVSHGIVHGWLSMTPVPMNELDKDAQVFKLNNAIVITNPFEIYGIENKWMYVSQSILFDFLVLNGLPTEFAAYVASSHPEGVYMKSNFIGQ